MSAPRDGGQTAGADGLADGVRFAQPGPDVVVQVLHAFDLGGGFAWMGGCDDRLARKAVHLMIP